MVISKPSGGLVWYCTPYSRSLHRSTQLDQRSTLDNLAQAKADLGSLQIMMIHGSAHVVPEGRRESVGCTELGGGGVLVDTRNHSREPHCAYSDDSLASMAKLRSPQLSVSLLKSFLRGTCVTSLKVRQCNPRVR